MAAGCALISSAKPNTDGCLQPPQLPVAAGDKRFALKKLNRDNPHASRVYICDACGSRNEFIRKSMPFDGQYVDVRAIRGRSVANLEKAYWAGEVNATWHCTECHRRKNENLEDTRIRLGLYDNIRIERTIERRTPLCRVRHEVNHKRRLEIRDKKRDVHRRIDALLSEASDLLDELENCVFKR